MSMFTRSPAWNGVIAVGARIAVGAGIEMPLGGRTRLALAGLVDVNRVLALS